MLVWRLRFAGTHSTACPLYLPPWLPLAGRISLIDKGGQVAVAVSLKFSGHSVNHKTCRDSGLCLRIIKRTVACQWTQQALPMDGSVRPTVVSENKKNNKKKTVKTAAER
jgi:hypothetical protein